MKAETLRKKLKKDFKESPIDEKKLKELKKYQRKTDRLKIIGITGSKGKSSVAYLLHYYLKKCGYRSVLYSSIEIDSEVSYAKKHFAVENPLFSKQTLLDAISQSIKIHADYLILEVNERAIKQQIIDDVDFNVRILTNIIEKHNSYFYDDYVGLKSSFLKNSGPDDTLILAVLDELTNNLSKELPSNQLKIVTSNFIKNKYNIKKCNYLIKPTDKLLFSKNGLEFYLNTNNKDLLIRSNLMMPYHAFDITLMVAAAKELGVYDEKILVPYLQTLNIPGRDQVIKHENILIIESISLCPQLEYLKQLQQRNEIGDIIVIVSPSGLGFNTWLKEHSDEAIKQEKADGIIFAYNYLNKYADYVYITTNDLGATNKETFLKYQESLLKEGISYEVIYSREEAITKAITSAKPTDVVYISGRGNRKVMCLTKDTMCLFDDLDIINKVIKEGGKNNNESKFFE